MEGLSSQNGIYEMTAGICRIEKVALKMADCTQGVCPLIHLAHVTLELFQKLLSSQPFKVIDVTDHRPLYSISLKMIASSFQCIFLW